MQQATTIKNLRDNSTAGTGEVVAAIRRDFKNESPAKGWRYLWNDGPIEEPSSYKDLLFGNTKYTPSGSEAFPVDPTGHLNLGPTGGHVGKQATTADASDQFVITAFTVSIDGTYYLGDSSIVAIDASCGDGIELQVRINERELISMHVANNRNKHEFNSFLGELQAGDIIYVAVGPNGSPYCDSFTWDFSLTMFPDDSPVIDIFVDTITTLQETLEEETRGRQVADFRTDFSATPRNHWSYLWNQGTIGSMAGYKPLLWDSRSTFDSDGRPGLPDNTAATWTSITGIGGHPGNPGRYAIACWEVQDEGIYGITRAVVSKVSAIGDGVKLRIFVNDKPFTRLDVGPGLAARFNTILGQLNTGDKIFIAIGPGDTNSNDSFEWSFSIQRFDVSSALGQMLAGVAVNAPGMFTPANPDCEPGLYGITRSVVTGDRSALEVCSENGWQHLLQARDLVPAVVDTMNSWRIASFRGDYSYGGDQGAWRYYYNRGALLDVTLYLPLKWNGIQYDSDGLPNFPDPKPGYWATFHGIGGHPGPGVDVGNPTSVIAAYNIPADGKYVRVWI